MKKLLPLIFIAFVGLYANAQKFKSHESHIRFFSDAPIEDIEATNTEATSIIDLESKAFVFSVPIKSFTFEKELMQEHFNENYLESEKYPKAIFKGKIKGWNAEKGEAMVVAEGEMSIHGVENQVSIEGTLNYDESSMTVTSVFEVALKDYKIKIPKALFYNIAEIVEVTISFQYQPYAQN